MLVLAYTCTHVASQLRMNNLRAVTKAEVVWTNFEAIYAALHREPSHILAFVYQGSALS
jgi:hypothetical protein